MKRFAAVICMVLAPVVFGAVALAQQEQSPAASAPVPHIVQYAGAVAAGATEPVVVRFSLYAAQSGGDPLWSELQTIAPDSKGRYSILLGSATPDGLPQSVFSSAEAKWLGVTVGDGQELSRTILVATPYALKSTDAETLGGHPLSDFALKNALPAGGTDITQINVGNGVTGGGSGPTVTLGLSSSYLETLGNEIYPQLGGTNKMTGTTTFAAGKLLVGTSPVLSASNLHASSPVTVTSSGGNVTFGLSDTALVTLGNSVYAQLGAANTFTKPITFASGQSFPGTVSLSANNTFTGSDTFSKAISFASGQTFPGTVSLGANNAFTGTNSFSAPITFASGQTFPGTGTITGVTAGTGLSGGGSSGSVTVNLNTSYLNSNYASLSSSDTFTSPVTVSGSGNPQLKVTTTGPGYAIQATQSGSSGVGVYATGPTGVFGLGVDGMQAYTTTATGTGIVAGGGASVGGFGVAASGFTAVSAVGSSTGFASSLGGDGTGVAASGFIGVLATGGTTAQTNYLAGTGVYATGYNAVVAEASGSTGFGVYASGATAVEALSSANQGIAIDASASNSTSTAVAGMSGDGTAGLGVFGHLTTTLSNSGYNGRGSGVWGDAGPGENADGAGVFGTADDNYAGQFANYSSNNPALVVTNLSATTGGTTAQFLDGSGNYCEFLIGGNLTCSGTAMVMPKRDDNRSIEMYSPQATENWFEDYGGGHLTNGSATVALDPTYAAMVNTGVEYRIFLTPNGDCKGLYVASKSAGSFEVRELGGGHASLSFDYKIVAKRKGMEDVRMRDVTEQTTRRDEAQKAKRQRQVQAAGQRAELHSSIGINAPPLGKHVAQAGEIK